MDVILDFVGLIGGIFGIISICIVINDRRQRLAIEKKDILWYEIRNLSLRPIPIKKITIRFRHKRYWGTWDEGEIVTPGFIDEPLPSTIGAEDSRRIDLTSTRNAVQFALFRTCRFEIETGTGKIVKRAFQRKRLEHE